LRTSLDTYSHYLERRRREHRKELLAALDSQRYATLLVRLEKFAIGGGAPRQNVALQSVTALLADEVERAHRRVCKRGRKVQAEPAAEELHALRIRAKRLRYTLELCRDLSGRDCNKAIRRLVRLQDLLGVFHDAVVAADFVRQYVEGPGKRGGAATLMTLGAFLGQELARAEDMRRDFARTWKNFERRRTARQFETIIRRLREHQSTVPSVANRDVPVTGEPSAASAEPTASAIEADILAETGVEDDGRRPPGKRGSTESDSATVKVVAAGYRRT
jgi:CHAD domain-containing protein